MAQTTQPVGRRLTQRTLAPWLFLAPGMFMFTVYVLWPIFQSISLSFYDWNGLYNKDGAFTGVFIGNSTSRSASRQALINAAAPQTKEPILRIGSEWFAPSSVAAYLVGGGPLSPLCGGVKPGNLKPDIMERVCCSICSCICTNMRLLCSI